MFLKTVSLVISAVQFCMLLDACVVRDARHSSPANALLEDGSTAPRRNTINLHSTTRLRDRFTTTAVNHGYKHNRTIPSHHSVNQDMQQYNGTNLEHGCLQARTHDQCAAIGSTRHPLHLAGSSVNINHASTTVSESSRGEGQRWQGTICAMPAWLGVRARVFWSAA